MDVALKTSQATVCILPLHSLLSHSETIQVAFELLQCILLEEKHFGHVRYFNILCTQMAKDQSIRDTTISGGANAVLTC